MFDLNDLVTLDCSTLTVMKIINKTEFNSFIYLLLIVHVVYKNTWRLRERNIALRI